MARGLAASVLLLAVVALADGEVAKKCGAGTECKDAVVLVVLEGLGLGVFGIDHFYMGSVGTGLLKLFTAGGCGIWVLVDMIVVFVNALKKHDHIDFPGIAGTFEDENMDTAYLIALIFVILNGVSCLCACLSCCCQLTAAILTGAASAVPTEDKQEESGDE
mmetsp:Transcript_144473/g.251862  ORF Transcript_144473/g.251862 Transcript_144473/m.251862 type:complete len:162 (+) Transcript_144473:61-546(+)